MTSPVDNRVTYFARTNFRNEGKVFGIHRRDRLYHLYLIGKTGTGKTTLMETMIDQDIENGEGIAVIDPHGDLSRQVLKIANNPRAGDVISFDLSNPDAGISFNPLQGVPVLKRPLIASNLLEAFKKIWADSWGPRMEHILRNSLLTLLDQPSPTLADLLRLLTDAEFRRIAKARIQNHQVREFWRQEFERYPVRFRQEAIAPIQNKVGAFLSNPLLQRIFIGGTQNLDLRKIMDEGRILVMNLSKGQIGDDTASLMGSLLVSTLGAAALSRADLSEKDRRPFFLYLDEFHSFTTLSLANMLSEIRKYGLSITMSNQHLSQLDPQVRDAVFGNAGTLISFRVGMADAVVLASEFCPVFTAKDISALANHEIYLKLMIKGRVSKPFSATTLTPFTKD